MKQKLNIIAAYDGPPNQTYVAVAQKSNIDSSTVSKIYKNNGALSDVNNLNNNRKKTPYKAEDVDTTLLKWFEGALATNINISGEILRVIAEALSVELNIENFVATNGWLHMEE